MDYQKQFNESELIAQLKRGSVSAFDELYKHYSARLLGFCIQYVKCKEDAEEIVQDTFIWLWNYRSSIRQDTTIKNILFLRAKHYLINAYRARVNSPLFEDYTLFLESFVSNDASVLEFDEFVARVNSIVDKMSATQATAFRMSRFEQLKNKEIAVRLNLSEQTVKNALSSVLKHLRSKLSDPI